jgi:excisionase family DNA binding protein
MAEKRQTLTVDEAAEILGIGRNSAYEAVRRGEIPAIRLGRRLVVPRHALEQLLRHTVPDTQQVAQNGQPETVVKRET